MDTAGLSPRRYSAIIGAREPDEVHGRVQLQRAARRAVQQRSQYARASSTLAARASCWSTDIRTRCARSRVRLTGPVAALQQQGAKPVFQRHATPFADHRAPTCSAAGRPRRALPRFDNATEDDETGQAIHARRQCASVVADVRRAFCRGTPSRTTRCTSDHRQQQQRAHQQESLGALREAACHSVKWPARSSATG